MYNFLILSLFSGMIELGTVFLGIHLNAPIPVIISLPLYYQLGNLMMNYIPKKKQICIVMSITVLILSIFSRTNYYYLSLTVQLIFSSFCIQITRDKHKKNCPTWLKRSFRITGFALSPLMLFEKGQLILITSITFCLFLLFHSSDVLSHQKPKNNEISFVMIFHQVHYFAYTYIMPIYLFQITQNYMISASIFAITWIIYLLPQTIAEKYNMRNYKKIFLGCHTLLALCMGSMTLSFYKEKQLLLLLFWLLTGLGGGSVFCIKHLTQKYKSIDMDLSENIGHVLGPLIAIIICAIFPNKEATLLTAFSCVSVIITLILATFNIQKENINHYE